MIGRPTARPLRSNFVTGRSAQRSTTPPVEPGLGVEHLAHLPAYAAQSVASRHRPPGRAELATSGERRRTPAGACGAASWATGRGRTSRARPRSRPEQVLQRPDRVDAEQTARCGPGVGQQARASPRRPGATPPGPARPPRAGGGQRGGRLPHAGADLHDQRRLAAEPRRQREPGLVDRLVGDHPARWCASQPACCSRREPAPAAGVGQHLPDPAAVLGTSASRRAAWRDPRLVLTQS